MLVRGPAGLVTTSRSAAGDHLKRLVGRRVLVVEDEYFIADDLAQALDEAGAIVVGPASTVEEAFALLERERPDLAILDINLKGKVSFAIADELARRELPFVFATGYESGAIPDRHAQRPRWQKPLRIEEMLAALGEA